MFIVVWALIAEIPLLAGRIYKSPRSLTILEVAIPVLAILWIVAKEITLSLAQSLNIPWINEYHASLWTYPEFSIAYWVWVIARTLTFVVAAASLIYSINYAVHNKRGARFVVWSPAFIFLAPFAALLLLLVLVWTGVLPSTM